MLSAFYRHSTISNYLMNRYRFRQLKCGKNVVVTVCKNSYFSYGKGVWLAEGVKLDVYNSRLSIADNVNICKNTTLAPGKSGISIGKRTKLQEHGRLVGEITIGEDVIIAPNFYMSSGIHVFNQEPHTLVSLQDRKYDSFGSECVIEDDCWIGINVCVMPGVCIRRGSIIGAGAVVTKSTDPYSINAGVPAKKIGRRLILEEKNILDANIAHNLPYFYSGFDHFNYDNNIVKHQGILTSQKRFALYTALRGIKSIELKIKPLSDLPCQLHNDENVFEIKPGVNNVIIKNIKVENQLIYFESSSSLIFKKINFHMG